MGSLCTIYVCSMLDEISNERSKRTVQQAFVHSTSSSKFLHSVSANIRHVTYCSKMILKCLRHFQRNYIHVTLYVALQFWITLSFTVVSSGISTQDCLKQLVVRLCNFNVSRATIISANDAAVSFLLSQLTLLVLQLKLLFNSRTKW